MKRHALWRLLIFGQLLAAVSGCESDDSRLARLSQDAAARQADQNREIARLVESQQALQQGIDAERGRLDQQRTTLDDERRNIARERIRDPIIANALIGAIILAACALPLLLALFVLRGTHTMESDEEPLSELLIQELVADEPLLLPRPNRPVIETALTANDALSGSAGDG
jgi:hypothetical protein